MKNQNWKKITYKKCDSEELWSGIFKLFKFHYDGSKNQRNGCRAISETKEKKKEGEQEEEEEEEEQRIEKTEKRK